MIQNSQQILNRLELAKLARFCRNCLSTLGPFELDIISLEIAHGNTEVLFRLNDQRN